MGPIELDIRADLHALTRKGPAILAIAPGRSRQRAAAVLFKAPKNHELECAVENQWIGQPGISQGLMQPCGGRPCGRDGRADAAVGASLDAFDALQFRAVKEQI